MIDAPQLLDQPTRTYVAIRRTVAPDGFAAAFDECFPRLADWLAQHDLAPSGPAMVRYRGDDADGYDVDIAFPVAAPPDAVAGEVAAGDVVAGEVVAGEVVVDALPAGRYAAVTHIGPYDGVAEAHGVIDDWISEAGLEQDDPQGARVEIYVSDPRIETDPTKLRVDVEQLLA